MIRLILVLLACGAFLGWIAHAALHHAAVSRCMTDTECEATDRW